MDVFEWKEEYTVGVSEIDMQHRQLFLLAEGLHEAVRAGQERTVLARRLANFVSSTRSSFAAEECLMRGSRYPAFVSHRFEHDTLTRKVLAFQQGFEAGRMPMTAELLTFLEGWLARHLSAVDRKMGAHLCAQVF